MATGGGTEEVRLREENLGLDKEEHSKAIWKWKSISLEQEVRCPTSDLLRMAF